MGGGVASLLAARWLQLFPSVRCFAFAAPCSVSEQLSRRLRGPVTSILLRDDVVCRLSLGRGGGGGGADREDVHAPHEAPAPRGRGRRRRGDSCGRGGREVEAELPEGGGSQHEQRQAVSCWEAAVVPGRGREMGEGKGRARGE
eukprot:748715-Hanusia_phi.AAC.1